MKPRLKPFPYWTRPAKDTGKTTFGYIHICQSAPFASQTLSAAIRFSPKLTKLKKFPPATEKSNDPVAILVWRRLAFSINARLCSPRDQRDMNVLKETLYEPVLTRLKWHSALMQDLHTVNMRFTFFANVSIFP